MSAWAAAGAVLQPAGPVAQTIAEMAWVLIAGAGVVFVVVMAALVWALQRRRPAPAGTGRDAGTLGWVVGAGFVFPVVVLSALLVYALWRTPGLAPPQDRQDRQDMVISVTGHLWWWQVHYHDPVRGIDVMLANEIHLPVGRAVTIGLSSADVIHSFWVPALAGKVDMVPGRVNHLLVEAHQTGVYRGQCAEYCGEQHARMALHVVARPPAEFDAWLAAQAQPAAAPGGPDAPLLERGRQAFLAQRCNACHTVRGVAGEGRLGPDLTHVGSRLYLGAGTLRNQSGSMAQWVAHTQAVKPGARMPSSVDMDGATLQALAAWLEHLK